MLALATFVARGAARAVTRSEPASIANPAQDAHEPLVPPASLPTEEPLEALSSSTASFNTAQHHGADSEEYCSAISTGSDSPLPQDPTPVPDTIPTAAQAPAAAFTAPLDTAVRRSIAATSAPTPTPAQVPAAAIGPLSAPAPAPAPAPASAVGPAPVAALVVSPAPASSRQAFLMPAPSPLPVASIHGIKLAGPPPSNPRLSPPPQQLAALPPAASFLTSPSRGVIPSIAVERTARRALGMFKSGGSANGGSGGERNSSEEAAANVLLALSSRSPQRTAEADASGASPPPAGHASTATTGQVGPGGALPPVPESFECGSMDCGAGGSEGGVMPLSGGSEDSGVEGENRVLPGTTSTLRGSGSGGGRAPLAGTKRSREVKLLAPFHFDKQKLKHPIRDGSHFAPSRTTEQEGRPLRKTRCKAPRYNDAEKYECERLW